MRFGRIETAAGERHDVRFVDGVARASDREWPLADVRILPPVEPGKLIYVGMNYRDHAAELNAPVPQEPLLFFKPRTALISHEQAVVRPPGTTQLEYEGELAVVIGSRCRNVAEADAAGVIAGYTIANDITARDWQRLDSQWTKAKSWDTFAPIGPWIETELDPRDVAITTVVNGRKRQQGSTRHLIFGVPELVAYASRVMTLEPGDVISTGTPPGVGPLEVGDAVEVTVDGIGTLRNVIVTEPAEE
ncbi:MAG TPA: fumarylacetoacetate hydrolase family protein [Solirubrobacteraceae bacterium]|nr:fumarylacetoacetate hydrolase family protein [Solirubrobacteraceae bacterium]